MSKTQINNQRRKYREKPSKQIIEKIKYQIDHKIKKASQLGQEYNIPRSTINSYKNAKGTMYNQLNRAVCQKLHELVDISFEVLKNYKKDSERKQYIKNYINNQQLFQFSDCNPFKELIPKTKIDSNKQRQITSVIQDALDYYYIILKNQQPQKDHQGERSITIYNYNEKLIQEDFNANPTQGYCNHNFEIQNENYPTDEIEFEEFFQLGDDDQYNSESYFKQ